MNFYAVVVKTMNLFQLKSAPIIDACHETT